MDHKRNKTRCEPSRSYRNEENKENNSLFRLFSSNISVENKGNIRENIKSRPSRSNDDWIKNIRMIINSKRWDYSVIKHLISLNSTLINVPKFNRKTLLEVMVLDDRGTEDIVSFLIDHGADVNLASYDGRLLLDALRCCRDRPGIVKVLIENGVEVKEDHGGICALDEAIYEGYKIDVLKLIVDATVDVNHVDRNLQSPLCRALSCGRELEVFKMLFDCEASVTACKCHQTPLHCLASARPIRTRVVELFLKKGAGGGNIIVDGLERTVLHNALRHSIYEEQAMCVLIKTQIADINARDSKDSTYLHDALWNTECKLEVVKCLIELGARVDSVDWTGETPLHKALLIRPCNLEIVRHLLKEGSPINVLNRVGETALVIAVKKRQDLSVIRLLMSSGERVNHPHWQSLSIAFNHFAMDRSHENVVLLQTVLKYAFLETPGMELDRILDLERTRCVDPNVWFMFWNRCLEEVRRMAVGRTWRNTPLLNIIGYGTTPTQRNCYDSLSRLDNKCVLVLIRDGKFPLYTEVLKAKVGCEYIADVFASIHLCAPYRDGKVLKNSCLTEHSLQYIGQFLSREDQLRMIFLCHRYFKSRRQ